MPSNNLPIRKNLYHDSPWWLAMQGETWFITVNCKSRQTNQLCHPHVASVIFDSINFRNTKGLWGCSLMLLMPDHLHALISFNPGTNLSKEIGNWKRWITNQCKIQWQRNFHDHRIRHDESLVQKAEYIRENPVRAKLCQKADNWKYVWADYYDGRGAIHPKDR